MPAQAPHAPDRSANPLLCPHPPGWVGSSRRATNIVSPAEDGAAAGPYGQRVNPPSSKEDAVTQPSTHSYDRTVTAVTLVIAPLCLLLSTIALPGLKSDARAQLTVVAHNHDRYYLFILLGIVATIALLPAIYGLMQLTRRERPLLGVLGGVLTLLGTALALVDYGSELVKWQMAAAGADRREMTALLERVDSAVGSAAPLQISGIAFLIGIAILAIGLARAHVAPVPVAVGLVAGTFLNLLGFASSNVLLLDVSGAVLVAAMGWFGWQLRKEPGTARPITTQLANSQATTHH
jgi:hypothetical protein